MIEIEKVIGNNWDNCCDSAQNLDVPRALPNQVKTIKQQLATQGFCVIKKKEDNIEDSIKLLDSIFSKKISQSKDPSNVTVKVTPVEGSRRILHSVDAQALHVDFGDNGIQPEVVALICVKASKLGGDSIIVPIDNVTNYISSLSLPEDTYNLLFKRKTITYERGFNNSLGRLLFKDQFGKSCFSFKYSDRIYCKHKSIEEIVKKIILFCHSPENQIRFKVKESEILIINNYKVLHGRSRFEGSRELIRHWYAGLKE